MRQPAHRLPLLVYTAWVKVYITTVQYAQNDRLLRCKLAEAALLACLQLLPLASAREKGEGSSLVRARTVKGVAEEVQQDCLPDELAHRLRAQPAHS